MTPPALCHCSGLCAHLGACLPACVTVCPLMVRADSAFLRLYLSIGFFESVSSLSVNKHEQACPPLPPPRHAQVAYVPEEKLVRFSAKLFNCTPAQLPSDLKASLVNMLSCQSMEGYLRPGCVHLTGACMGGVRGWVGGTVALAIVLSKPLRAALPPPSVCALVWSGACMHLPACQLLLHA